jgi:hypothetical protein
MSRWILVAAVASFVGPSAYAAPSQWGGFLQRPTADLPMRSSLPPARLYGYVVVEEGKPAPPQPAPKAISNAQAAPKPEEATAAATPAAVAPAPVNLAPTAAPSAAASATPTVLGTDWSYYQEKDGTIWRARRTNGHSPKIWGTGLALVVVSFILSSVAGGYEPIVGGFVAAGTTNANGGNGGLQAALILDGLVGLGGGLMVLSGAVWGKSGVEKQQIKLTPTASLEVGGSGLSVHF